MKMGKLVNMKYRVYKEFYRDEKIVPGSYNSKNKTVDVYLSDKKAKEYHLNVEEIRVPIPYWLYKKEFQNYYYEKDSYDYDKKTVIVYMTVAEAMARGFDQYV